MASFIDQLRQMGFEETAMGGNCRALIRKKDGRTEVITDGDCDLPEPSAWRFASYEGDWLADPYAPLVDTADHQTAPLHLFEFLKI